MIDVSFRKLHENNRATRDVVAVSPIFTILQRRSVIHDS